MMALLEQFNWHYLYVFLQSNALEVLFLLFFYHVFQYWDRLSNWEIILKVTLANSITHPIVIFFILKGPLSYIEAILVAEVFAIVTEIFLHQKYLGIGWTKATVGSIIANLISWQFGTVLTTFFFLSDRV